jgi:predicted transcriptional regulator
MRRQVTLELPDDVLNRAERLATLTRRDVREVLAEAVRWGLQEPLSP